MRIGSLDTDTRVVVVAEVGNNHEGDVERAQELVRAAAAAGADAVKFQTYKTELFVRPVDEERFARLKSFELSQDAFAGLADVAHELGLAFVSTPLDLESAAFLDEIADAVKIASGDNTFVPLIRRVAAGSKPMIMSTGLVDLDETRVALELARSARPPGAEVALLHCVTAYPARPAEINLRAIPELAAALGCTVGYSDHTLGIEACVAAAAIGARILEKHVTLDPPLSDFRDHELSARPEELAELVRRVRLVEELLGSGEKRPQASELELRDAVRRSIAARRDLRAGHRIGEDDISWLRPGGGIAPGHEADVVGGILGRDVSAGEQLRPDDVEKP
ncbi:MAG TPA: N-acetylneuraminate synthase family protein [Gaiellaceae bacterium]|nr:N-acetylneuraminate synthase family protein [Gaiellaceae bacterium]